MVDSAYFVKSTLLRAFTGAFQHFADMLQTYWRCARRSLIWKNIFWQTDRVFNLSHFLTTAPSKWCLIVYTSWNQLLLELLLDLFNTLKIYCRHIEDVHEEVWCSKNIFWQTYRIFNLAIYRQLHLVNVNSLDLFNRIFTSVNLFVFQYAGGIK